MPLGGGYIGRPRKDAANTQTFSSDGSANKITLDFGALNPKQAEFWKSKARYTCFGGARGGGKSHVLRLKAVYGCLKFPGIKILIVRRQYDDLLQNHIEPLKQFLPQVVAEYNNSTHIMYFANGSTIKFGHYNYDSSADKYQGQEYDWIMIDEATQFTEEQFRMLGACLRGVNKISKQMFLTCNPGGVGHRWVKRLFIEKRFDVEKENPKDYKFIFAKVEDNVAMKEIDPKGYEAYLIALETMPEKFRAAHRYGDWDALSGNYFDEFRTDKHVVKPFKIPDNWRRYRAFDYGLDMFACYWVAVDFEGHYYAYREFCEKDLIVPEAAQEIHNNTLPSEHIDITFAPPDMWNTQKTDGKTMAEGFMLGNVPIVKVSNNRVQGHMQLKEMLADMPDGKPQLMFFENCIHIIEDLPAIQADEKNPNDCAKQPHDITHTVDALRYFCISRTMPAFTEEVRSRYVEDDDGETVEEYDSYLTGGEVTQSYLNY